MLSRRDVGRFKSKLASPSPLLCLAEVDASSRAVRHSPMVGAVRFELTAPPE